VFKKLFGRKEAPINDGKSTYSEEVDGTSLVKNFVLELSNMEGTPSYKLTHQLTVGSEVGNIVIADPSVSPRHCTFILQEEVVSVLDHGSVAGTFINGQKIPPGRYIILEETDNIRVGDLEVQIHIKNETIQNETTNQAIEEDIEETEEVIEEQEDLEEEVEEEADEEEANKTGFLKRFFKSKAKKRKAQEVLEQNDYRKVHKKELVKEDRKPKPVSFATNSPYATNSLVRVFAVISDLIIAYTLYIILSPFTEFQSFVSDVPIFLKGLFDVDWNGIWLALNEDYAFLGEILKDLYNFFSVTFNLGPLFLLFILTRIISTLIFGVSISEAFLGVRSHGNAIWKRIGGVLRVLIGIVTGPFLIFDVPAVVSRRTFKEFMTFTHTYVISKFFTILGVILYVPLLMAIALLAPLIQGFELPEPIVVMTNLERRIKVVPPTDSTVDLVKTKDVSKFLKMEIEFDSQSISLIPSFKFTEVKKKLNYRPSLNVYHKDIQRSVRLELFKTFDLKELLGIGVKGDFIVQEKFPAIDAFVRSEGSEKLIPKTKQDETDNRKFADEVVTFTKIAFELSAENALEQMQAYTPYLKGLLDYKASLLSLLEYKKMNQIDFIKLGNAYFLRISYMGQKPFDLIIPLIKGEGRIFKVEFDKKQDLGVLRNKFYKFSLDQTDWFPGKEGSQDTETFKPLQVIDFFARLDVKGEKVESEKAQAIYGYYYEKSAEVLKRNDAVEYDLWKKSVDSIFMIMKNMKDSIPEAVAPPITEDAATEPTATEDPRMKLFQNFQDLKDAVENKNNEYFAIEDSFKI
jgi:hypothetical protein